MSDESFLSRWSRRKRQAARRKPEPAGSGFLEADADNPPAVAEPEITADELARLPSVEELTAESDLAQFLRKGVPLALRNAALRRGWALDPKIRDYVGEARDYAYDWNTPTGVPGSGPLAEQDIEELLRRVIGDGDPQLSPAPPQPAADTSPGTRHELDASPSEQPASARPDQAADVESTPKPPPIERRHGRAMPI